MKRKTIIPQTISGFTEYIKHAYATAEQNLTAYGINPGEFAKITPLYSDFVSLESQCANPTTATRAGRDARNKAWKDLEKQWRVFLNREIRNNDAISVAGKEDFGILPHDTIRTTPEIPKETGTVTAVRKGDCLFDCIVENAETGKKKHPDDAIGSNLYSAIVEVDQPAPRRNTFHFEGFSSTSHHMVHFSDNHLAKRAYLFARYTNSHGQEGPEGPITAIIIN